MSSLKEQELAERNIVAPTLDTSQVKVKAEQALELENVTAIKKERKELEQWRDGTEPKIRPSKKRFFILFMFIVLQMIKSFQWICLASITNITASFYNVDNLAINATTIMFMVTFLIFGLPVSWLMEFIGLRRSMLVGTFGVSLGIAVKLCSCHPGGFNMSLLGHLIIGLSEPFFFSSYPQIASLWFPDNQVGLATAVGFIGEQVGLALGFIVPPLMTGSDPNDKETIQAGLFKLFLVISIMTLLNSASIVIFFDEEPKYAPGIARYRQRELEREKQESSQLQNGSSGHMAGNKSLMTRIREHFSEQATQSGSIIRDGNFLLLLIGFGINVGTAYSLHTLLNQMIATELPASSSPSQFISIDPPSLASEDRSALVVGNAGLILIVAGLFGSAISGHLLDVYHRYKLTTAAVYLLSVASMALLTLCLQLDSPLALYLVMIPLGYALSGYASCGFDYGVELTYPKVELLSATQLNLIAQLFGIPISLVGSKVVDLYGNQAVGVFLTLILFVGFLLTCFQGGQLKRQTAVLEGKAADLATQQA